MSEIEDQRIPVSGGCTLSARIWMPQEAEETPLPAILEILPYRKRDQTVIRDASTHAQFAQHGYVCLRVDLRGTGQSEGLFDDEYSEQELSDIETVIAWIAEQSWCSGAVGIMGISWGGFNGLQVAARRPAALKAVISSCSSVDRFADDIHFKGGCQLTENIGWAATAMSWFSMPPDPALSPDWREVWLERLDEMPFLAEPWIGNDERNAYWRHGSVCEDFSAIEAPVLIIGGWHDGYRNTPAKLLEGGTSGPVKALIGPWNHKYPHLATPGPQVDFIGEALRWWDHWLKGVDNGVEADPACHLYLMDGIAPRTSYDHRPGRWLALPEWPCPRITPLNLHLGDGSLGETPLSTPTTVQTDPLSGQCSGEFFPYGFGPGELPDDQQPDDARSVCFDTAPLDTDLDLVGAAQLSVTLSCSSPTGQMVARLCEVAPDGRSTLISFGVLNLAFRDGFETPVPMPPDTPQRIELSLDQAAYRVRAGHRLRLAIAPSYWPFIWPEAQPSALTIHAGQLCVPQLSDAVRFETSLPEPASPAPYPAQQTRPGVEDRHMRVENGWHTVVITGDQGETTLMEHGLRYSSAVKEEWAISTHHPLEARATITWKRGLTRDGIDVSTELVTTMHSDATTFRVSTQLTAYDANTCIFDRSYAQDFPRALTDGRQE